MNSLRKPFHAVVTIGAWLPLALGASPADAGTRLTADPGESVLRCAGKVYLVRYDRAPDQAIIRDEGLTLALPLQGSASGSRYATDDGRDELWISGNEARVTIGGKLRRCRFQS